MYIKKCFLSVIMNNNSSESNVDNAKKYDAPGALGAGQARPYGRPRRFGADFPDLPFKEYEKLWRQKYTAIKNEQKDLQHGPRKKIGRPQKYYPEDLGIESNDDGSFHCTFCNHCFRYKPERHAMGVHCSKVRRGVRGPSPPPSPASESTC